MRIAKRHNVTSIADFLAARYGKSRAARGPVTAIAIIGVLPYIALQLQAVSTSFAALAGTDHHRARHRASRSVRTPPSSSRC